MNEELIAKNRSDYAVHVIYDNNQSLEDFYTKIASLISAGYKISGPIQVDQRPDKEGNIEMYTQGLTRENR
jgi:hypothetical protein